MQTREKDEGYFTLFHAQEIFWTGLSAKNPSRHSILLPNRVRRPPSQSIPGCPQSPDDPDAGTWARVGSRQISVPLYLCSQEVILADQRNELICGRDITCHMRSMRPGVRETVQEQKIAPNNNRLDILKSSPMGHVSLERALNTSHPIRLTILRFWTRGNRALHPTTASRGPSSCDAS